MDIPRPSQAKAKRKKRITMIVVAVLALGGITFGLSQLKPAAPTVDRNLVWVGTVERGPMVRQVRGLGTLVPENIRWVAASTQARVETIIIRPGAFVEPGTLILELSNPDVMQAAETAESSLQAAQAQLVNTRVQIESGLLQAESNAASAKAAYEQARLRYEVNKELFADGLVSTLELELYKITAEEAETRHQIEQKRYAFAQESIKPQLAVQEAEVARLEAQARLRQSEADALHVRATMAGVLSALPVEVGAQVQPGQNLARVADPTDLKAEVRIAETQAKDIAIGQNATIDTRNGIVAGRVVRIDPAVQNGTVLVDACWDWGGGDFETPLQAAAHVGQREIAEFLLAHGARPDLFAAAMLGQLDVLKATFDLDPTIDRVHGPHGFTLYHCARRGGESAQAVVDFLVAQGVTTESKRALPFT